MPRKRRKPIVFRADARRLHITASLTPPPGTAQISTCLPAAIASMGSFERSTALHSMEQISRTPYGAIRYD